MLEAECVHVGCRDQRRKIGEDFGGRKLDRDNLSDGVRQAGRGNGSVRGVRRDHGTGKAVNVSPIDDQKLAHSVRISEHSVAVGKLDVMAKRLGDCGYILGIKRMSTGKVLGNGLTRACHG